MNERHGLEVQDWRRGSLQLLKGKSKELESVVSMLQAGVQEERESKILQASEGLSEATHGAMPWTQGWHQEIPICTALTPTDTTHVLLEQYFQLH